MAEGIWTAAEFEQLTPAEREAVFEAGVIWDLEDAPPELLARTAVQRDVQNLAMCPKVYSHRAMAHERSGSPCLDPRPKSNGVVE